LDIFLDKKSKISDNNLKEKPMNQTLENRREVYPEGFDLYFYTPPRIANRSDALGLLDDLLGADYVNDLDMVYKALRDAIAREVV
jgi:hypothetical protein